MNGLPAVDEGEQNPVEQAATEKSVNEPVGAATPGLVVQLNFEGPACLANRKQLRLQQWLAITVEAYQAVGMTNPAYDEQVIQVLTHVSHRLAKVSSPTSDAEIMALGEQV